MVMNKKINKLWGSAFEQSPTKELIAFTGGRDVHGVEAVDYKLLYYDLWGNKAHAYMLYKQGIIEKKDVKTILKGLLEIEKLVEAKKFFLDPQKEDVHTNVESFLIDKYGIGIAGKLHTARSRNDQSNLDTRLYLRDNVILFSQKISDLANCLCKQAALYKNIPVPGFTHHQHAMVTTLGHIYMTFAAMMVRDAERMTNWFALHNTNPLGAAASYGTSFPIDQKLTASMLAFDDIDTSSLDYITNRWEPEADLAFAITVLMNHLSTMAETLILFSTAEFGMLKLSDMFSTGSSMMPQKKNPDPLEIIKGKASLSAGFLLSLIGSGKGTLIGYNRDSQWTKYLISDLIDECMPAPSIMKGIFETLTIDKEKMHYWTTKDFIGATSLLEQLSWKYSISFRKAKIVVEKAVKYSKGEELVTYTALNKALKEENFDIKVSAQQVIAWQDPVAILKNTNSIGGPGQDSLKLSLQDLNKKLKKLDQWIMKKANKKKMALAILEENIKAVLTGGKS